MINYVFFLIEIIIDLQIVNCVDLKDHKELRSKKLPQAIKKTFL